ncbi:hypothetical protein AB0I30_13800 [Nocardia tengchongensis]|uniref:hypothetical protein n=1 Tax=Nocardia tengchongensis TaxID=2055889 RepID=UPI0033DE44CE
MAELRLTRERRTELVALLGDDGRLRADFPVVADYLSTAPMLAGTGDERLDAAFDLGLVHYLTGGDSVTGNPYWDIVGELVFTGTSSVSWSSSVATGGWSAAVA